MRRAPSPLPDVRRGTPAIDRLVERLPSPVDDVVRRLRSEDVPMLAAGQAFYAMVSVAPSTILAPGW